MKIAESSVIKEVQFVELNCFEDTRGSFSEIFRQEWFPHRDWHCVQLNRSISKQNVLRGLHYHFQQIDYWYVLSGTLRIALLDLRESSETFFQSQVFDLDSQSNVAVYIPPGVAHGYLAKTDGALMYVVDQYFNAQDELGIRWDDPTIKIDWGIAEPIISPRDELNPLWKDVPSQLRPR